MKLNLKMKLNKKRKILVAGSGKKKINVKKGYANELYCKGLFLENCPHLESCGFCKEL